MLKASQQSGGPEEASLETERVATAEWPERLKACVETLRPL